MALPPVTQAGLLRCGIRVARRASRRDRTANPIRQKPFAKASVNRAPFNMALLDMAGVTTLLGLFLAAAILA